MNVPQNRVVAGLPPLVLIHHERLNPRILRQLEFSNYAPVIWTRALPFHFKKPFVQSRPSPQLTVNRLLCDST